MATRPGVTFGIKTMRMILVLAELGWIEQYTKGWKPTPQSPAGLLAGDDPVGDGNDSPPLRLYT